MMSICTIVLSERVWYEEDESTMITIYNQALIP